MATFAEDRVAVTVTLNKLPDGTYHAFVMGGSYAGPNLAIRAMGETEVTSSLTPAQQAAAKSLVDAAEVWMKTQFQIA